MKRLFLINRKNLLLILLVTAMMLSCAEQKKDQADAKIPSVSEFSNGASSIDSLMLTFVSTLNNGDSTGLKALLITEAEHNQLLGPEFHMHYPSVSNESIPVLWENLNLKTTKGFNKLTGNYFRKNYSFVSVRFEEAVETYRSFRLHQGTVVMLRDSTGNEFELRLLGSVAERSGYFKILSIKG